MASEFIDPYGTEYWDYPSGTKQVRKDLRDVGRGISYAPQDLLGFPVDLINIPLLTINALTGKKIFSEKPVGGSEWLIEQSHKALPAIIPKPDYGTGETLGRIGAGLMNPAGVVRSTVKAGAKGAQAAKEVGKQFEEASLELARRATGNRNLTMDDLKLAAIEEANKIHEAVLFGGTGAQSPSSTNIIKPTGGKQYQTKALDTFVNRWTDDFRNEGHLQDMWNANAPQEAKNLLDLNKFDINNKYLADFSTISNQIQDAAVGKSINKNELDAYINFHNRYIIENSPISKKYPDLYELKKKHLALSDNLANEIKLRQDEISRQFGIPTINDLDAPRLLQNEWVNTILRRYAHGQHGTADDPALKLLQQGIKDWYQADLASNPSRPSRYANIEHHKVAGVEREPISPKSQPEARRYERNLERDLVWGGSVPTRAIPADAYVRRLQGTKEGRTILQENPWIKKAAAADPKQPFFGTPQMGYTARALVDEVKQLANEGKLKILPSGKLDPATSSKASIESVLRSANERILAKRVAESKDKEALQAWAKARYETLEKPMVWADGDAIAKVRQGSGTLLDIKRDLSYQTHCLNHCVGSGGRTGGRWIPAVEPHTGKPSKGAEPGIGTEYAQDVFEGKKEIQWLLDKEGTPYLTMDLSPNGEGSYTLHQIKGKEDKAIPANKRQKVIDYLNSQPIHNVYWTHGDDGVMNKIFVNDPLSSSRADFNKIVSDDLYKKILQLNVDDFYSFVERMWSQGHFMDYKDVEAAAKKALSEF